MSSCVRLNTVLNIYINTWFKYTLNYTHFDTFDISIRNHNYINLPLYDIYVFIMLLAV